MGQLLRLLNYLRVEKAPKEADAQISAPQGLSNLGMSGPRGIGSGRMSRTSNLQAEAGTRPGLTRQISEVQ